jgi:enoyl-CoA hydratase
MTSEGLGQLYLRLLTDNFEEATRARKEGRPPAFRDRR